ncbi:MAG: CotH kinase family protein [Lysobacterales bacterium]
MTSFTAGAQSIFPEDGWWWNADAPGRGYLLERQGNVIFMTSFHYTDGGAPEWLTIQGTYSPADTTSEDIGTLVADVSRSENGQCIGCDYVEPMTTVSIQDPAVVTFHNNQSATLSWTGETVPLSRFFWNFSDSLQQLSGQWLFATIAAGTDPVASIVTVTVDGETANIVSQNDEVLGALFLDEGVVSLSLNTLDADLTVLVPETQRFYAGTRSSDTDAVVGLRIDDLPLSASIAGNSDSNFVAVDWTTETHSNDVDPNFEEVFNDTQVKRLDFVVTEERWQSMLADMTATYGEFGTRTGGNGLIDTDEDPIFVPAEVFYQGTQWYRVGIRFKGNSTLQGSWESGILKLSFKLDFDEFEDDYPQIDNQRFYGFKKFSLKNNFDDESIMREKVAADVFRDAGVPVSHTGFYTLYVDHGNGPEYFGLYTLVEEVDGPVLDTQFSSDDGNLYKPEEGSANFVEGTFNTENFEKKTNEDDEDWSDVMAMFGALHDDSATTNPIAWRTNLEAVFDVDGFLKYLAVNEIIQNWDTYGLMPHNYYLYNNPDNGLLTWIPWDNNESLQTGRRGGALSLDFSNLNAAEWPLIARIYADDVYRQTYNSYLTEVMSSAFETSKMQLTYDTYAALIAPYATSELPGFSFLEGDNDFNNAVEQLKAHAAARASAVTTYLNSQ